MVVLSSILVGCEMPKSAQESGPMNPAQFVISSVWFFLAGFFVYYMLVLKPNITKEDAQKKFIQEIKKNDSVLVNEAILGKVQGVKDDIVTVEIAPNVRLQVLASAINPAPEKKTDQTQEKSI